MVCIQDFVESTGLDLEQKATRLWANGADEEFVREIAARIEDLDADHLRAAFALFRGIDSGVARDLARGYVDAEQDYVRIAARAVFYSHQQKGFLPESAALPWE